MDGSEDQTTSGALDSNSLATKEYLVSKEISPGWARPIYHSRSHQVRIFSLPGLLFFNSSSTWMICSIIFYEYLLSVSFTNYVYCSSLPMP
jgi:hypothetical protein